MTTIYSDTQLAQPLKPLKRLPPSSMASTSAKTPSSKRAKLTLHAPMTPHPSSDADIEAHDGFEAGLMKLSAVPMRISTAPMTPSASTVAFSSSPRRAMMSSSSPTRTAASAGAGAGAQFHPYAANKSKKGDLEHDIVLRQGSTIIFGRHRHNQSNSSSTTLESSIPKNLSHLLANPTNDASVVHLSRHASHASRVHAAVELVETNVMRVIVIGQNGMRLRIQGQKKGVRLLQGQRYDLSLNGGGDEAAELDFFGCRAIVRTEEEEERRERLFSSSPMSPIPLQSQRLELASSLPPSSPPMMAMDLDEELSEEEHEPEPEREEAQLPTPEDMATAIANEHIDTESNHSRDSSPLSPPSEAHFDLAPSPAPPSSPPHVTELALPEEPITEKSIKAEQLESLAHPHGHGHGHNHGHGHAKPISRASSPARPVPADVDLPAIIASTVVFSGSSKLSLPDLVKHMLEAQPSLKEHGDEARWSGWVGEQVESNPMFGKVERHGKDSSGHPLLPHYFYNPASDPDTSRAKELGGLVRPLRSVQRGGGKAIDWRPVGRGRRS